MAKLEEGQTAEYWWEKAEIYRRQLGGANAANTKLKSKLRLKEKRIAELEHALRDAYSLMSCTKWQDVMGAANAMNLCKRIEQLEGLAQCGKF